MSIHSLNLCKCKKIAGLIIDISILKHFLYIIKRISIGKSIKLFFHFATYYIYKISGLRINPPLPWALTIEPTTSCNLRCPQCPSGLRKFTRPTGMLSLDNFDAILASVLSHTAYVNLYFQGEPFLNQDIYSIIRKLTENKIYSLASTNAHYIDSENAEKIVASGLGELIVSVDGTDQDTYSQYRVGGNLDKVLTGLKHIQEAKKKTSSDGPYVVVQFIVFKYNEHQINEIKDIASKYRVDELRIKSAQIYDFQNTSELIPSDKYSRYKLNKEGQWTIKGKLANSCWKMWHSCVITWDGKVVPCCFDKDAKYEMGNLLEQPLETIWKGDKYRQFRNQIKKGRKNIDICSNCTEGLKVSLKD